MAIIGSLLAAAPTAPQPEETASEPGTTTSSPSRFSYVGWLASGTGSAITTVFAADLLIKMPTRGAPPLVYAFGNVVLGGFGALLGIAVFNRLSDKPCEAKWGAVASGAMLGGLGCFIGVAFGTLRYGAPLSAALGTWLMALALSLPWR